jgi:hypothetical protein
MAVAQLGLALSLTAKCRHVLLYDNKFHSFAGIAALFEHTLKQNLPVGTILQT